MWFLKDVKEKLIKKFMQIKSKSGLMLSNIIVFLALLLRPISMTGANVHAV